MYALEDNTEWKNGNGNDICELSYALYEWVVKLEKNMT